MDSTLLEVMRGDTKTWTLYVEDDDGNDIDISGYTVFFTAKNNINDSDDDAVIKKTITSHTNPTAGETQIDLTSTDTAVVANLVFDIQVKKSTGEIVTITPGILSILQDITLRTS